MVSPFDRGNAFLSFLPPQLNDYTDYCLEEHHCSDVRGKKLRTFRSDAKAVTRVFRYRRQAAVREGDQRSILIAQGSGDVDRTAPNMA